ncbi:3-hydroxyacyl-CoA dehydrogenase family protein [Pseudomonas sp. 008]|uniref:3-hydroxyacyl-CoA dehydrogenase family protein n=1 Tax=Pseudomonas sp. 008 TaxID=2803906 RepID=UPI00194E70EB|nr:3-hydroxyacyl-CoA dehydrogenase family protein [Pseudomonas sp. 008]GID03282.1 hypothetical protein TMM008_04840 [Pseudomonas sp. 008]
MPSIFELTDTAQLTKSPFTANRNTVLLTPPWTVGHPTKSLDFRRAYLAQSFFESLNREAHRLVLEGSTPTEVDAVLTLSKSNMGILESNDHFGIDLLFWSRSKKRMHLKNDLSYFVLSDELFKLGRYGKKTGRGFYRYESTKHEDPEVPHIAAMLAHEIEVPYRNNITVQEIRERLLLTLIIEGINLINELPLISVYDIVLVFTQEFQFSFNDGEPTNSPTALDSQYIASRIDHYKGSLGSYGATWFQTHSALVHVLIRQIVDNIISSAKG